MKTSKGQNSLCVLLLFRTMHTRQMKMFDECVNKKGFLPKSLPSHFCRLQCTFGYEFNWAFVKLANNPHSTANSLGIARRILPWNWMSGYEHGSKFKAIQVSEQQKVCSIKIRWVRYMTTATTPLYAIMCFTITTECVSVNSKMSNESSPFDTEKGFCPPFSWTE